jgi:outer membrane lipoprotein-sorting protein
MSEKRIKTQNQYYNIRHNHLICIFLVLLFPHFPCFPISPSFAQFTPVTDIESFRQRLAAENKRFTTIECDFTQYKHLTIMDEPLVSSGRFFFQQDDKVRLDYAQPSPYLIEIDGQKVSITADGKSNVYDMSAYRMITMMKSMLTACLRGDFSGAGRDYQMTVSEDGSAYQVEIEPRNRNVRRYIQKIDIVFDKKDMSLNQLVIREPSGDYTQHVFSNKKIH